MASNSKSYLTQKFFQMKDGNLKMLSFSVKVKG